MTPVEGPREVARRRRGEGGLPRRRLLDAAVGLLGELDSPESLTLRMVARRAGVPAAGAYSHFADLDDLIGTVLTDRHADLAAGMELAARATNEPLDELAARTRAYVHWGLEHPGHYRVVFEGRIPADVTREPGAGEGAAMLECVAASLAGARDAGEGPPAEPSDTRWRAGLLLWTGLHGIVSLRINTHAVDWPDVDDMLADLLVAHSRLPRDRVRRAVRRAAGGPARALHGDVAID
jgi:AcrR family transcriptional regulator